MFEKNQTFDKSF